MFTSDKSRTQNTSEDAQTAAKRTIVHRPACSLADLKQGDCGTIHYLSGSARGRLRLMEMGLTPGVHVKVMRLALFCGPRTVELRGFQMSLRLEEVSAIHLIPWIDEVDEE